MINTNHHNQKNISPMPYICQDVKRIFKGILWNPWLDIPLNISLCQYLSELSQKGFVILPLFMCECYLHNVLNSGNVKSSLVPSWAKAWSPRNPEGVVSASLFPGTKPLSLATAAPHRVVVISHIRAMPQALPHVDEASLTSQTKTKEKEMWPKSHRGNTPSHM